jgi:hypothetical protein
MRAPMYDSVPLLVFFSQNGSYKHGYTRNAMTKFISRSNRLGLFSIYNKDIFFFSIFFPFFVKHNHQIRFVVCLLAGRHYIEHWITSRIIYSMKYFCCCC